MKIPTEATEASVPAKSGICDVDSKALECGELLHSGLEEPTEDMNIGAVQDSGHLPGKVVDFRPGNLKATRGNSTK